MHPNRGVVLVEGALGCTCESVYDSIDSTAAFYVGAAPGSVRTLTNAVRLYGAGVHYRVEACARRNALERQPRVPRRAWCDDVGAA